MKLGDDPNPTNISNLTALNLDGMSFDSRVPDYIVTASEKNKSFNADVIKRTLTKVYGVEHVEEIYYKKRLNNLIIGIGTHRSNEGGFNGIKFRDPVDKEDMDTFKFVSMFGDDPDEKKFDEMTKGEK